MDKFCVDLCFAMKLGVIIAVLSWSSAIAFVQTGCSRPFALMPSRTLLHAEPETEVKKAGTTTAAPPSILGDLRAAAMQLHTTQQAPKEGGIVVEEPKEPYVPTRDDYLAFLVDSKHVYEALEEIVNNWEGLEVFRNSGLERTKPLEIDINFMVDEYGLTRPEPGDFGIAYAKELHRIRETESIPEFMCHFYNFYFAHLAGGRMIGRNMSSLLLDNKTLEFYKVSLFCFVCTHNPCYTSCTDKRIRFCMLLFQVG